MRKDPPCKGCKDRQAVPPCHAVCKPFLDWKKAQEANKEAQRQAQMGVKEVATFRSIQRERRKHKHISGRIGGIK